MNCTAKGHHIARRIAARLPERSSRFASGWMPVIFLGVVCLAILGLGSGCTPRVTIEVPKEPIVINMNIKIEHEIRVKVDKDLEDLFEDDELF